MAALAATCEVCNYQQSCIGLGSVLLNEVRLIHSTEEDQVVKSSSQSKECDDVKA